MCAAPTLAASSTRPERSGQPEAPLYDLIELMFFAYRDFVGDADRLLTPANFGRAHHRVLHFVHRHPGLSVAALLDILKITKQSLSRVMKDLVDAGLIEMRSGEDDRRQRLLFLSGEGEALAGKLSVAQSERFRRALAGQPPGAHQDAADFLLRLVNPEERTTVMRLIASPHGLTGAGRP